MSKKRAFLGLILGFLTVVLISVAIPFLYMKITERPEENEKQSKAKSRVLDGFFFILS